MFGDLAADVASYSFGDTADQLFRYGQLYVFADKEAGFSEAEGMKIITMPTVNDITAPIYYTVPMQLLAYHIALIKGTDVDQPRNLAKAVTVE